jgi:isopenicillin N synthase-like dioxygenase
VDSDKLPPDELRLTTPIHTDSGFLTFLSTFGYPGLQVDVGEGVYKSVRPVPNTMVVNLGDMLSRTTGYRLKATKHRVLDIGVERYSSPFFFEPRYAASIPSTIAHLTSASEITDEECVYFGHWVIGKMSLFGEFKDWPLTI